MQKIERAGILFAIVTSVVGVAVSLVSLLFSLEANRLVAQQNAIMAEQYVLERYGGEPVFTVEWKKDGDGLPYYVIKNNGAEIHDVTFSGGRWLLGNLACREEESGKMISPGYSIDLVYDAMLPGFQWPDFSSETQSIQIYAYQPSAYPSFHRDSQEPYNIWADLKNITASNNVYNYSVELYIHVGIHYKDYRNNSCTKDVVIESRLYEFDNKERYGEKFTFSVGDIPDHRKIEIMARGTPWIPLEGLQEAIDEYIAEHNLILGYYPQ